MRSPLEMFGDGCAPVDDGAEDLGWVRLWCWGKRSELASNSNAFGLLFLAGGTRDILFYHCHSDKCDHMVVVLEHPWALICGSSAFVGLHAAETSHGSGLSEYVVERIVSFTAVVLAILIKSIP